MTDPQNPSPWQNPDNPQSQIRPGYDGASSGTYEVQAMNQMGLPMPPAPEPAPPLDHAQWQNPQTASYQNVGASHGTYEVQAVNNMGFPMPPLAPAQPQEMSAPRPATITAAMWIWIAGAVLSVAVFPVLLLTNAEFLLSQDESLVTAEDRMAGEFGVRAMALMFGFAMLVAAAPYVAFAVVLRNGQNWARILLTILGALGFLSMVAIMFFALAAEVWQPGVAISIVVMGLIVAAVVLQFLPPSNKFVR
ncbi:hypothetical protein C8D88_101205 [Lentzea atacamensis]|uniref:Uncharacterized protein n=2 Tax=Lentzea TaxID=165301 RepID=A0A316IBN6_9PSEU|nr:hypothetical protein [Lentzea atacamensis]PWK90193.1 hypothetical protein C8D88_101205 [Lentzea atacamensis]